MMNAECGMRNSGEETPRQAQPPDPNSAFIIPHSALDSGAASPPAPPAAARRLPWRLYLVGGIILLAIPWGGYGLICLRDAWRARLEENFRKPAREFFSAGEAINSVAILPDGKRVFSGDDDWTLHLWEIETGADLRQLTGHGGPVSSVAVLPDGQRALSGSYDGTLVLWDINAGTELRRLTGHTDWIRSVAVLPDGRRAFSGGNDNTLRLWDLETGEELLQISSGRTDWTIATLPDGRRALSAGGKLQLWDLESGKELRLLSVCDEVNAIHAVSVLPDGKRALSDGSDGGTLRLWDLETGAVLQQLVGHRYGGVWSIAVLPNGRRAISAGYDGTLRLWDLETGLQVRAFHLPARNGMQSRYCYAVAVTSDGQRAVSGGAWLDAEGQDHAELFLWRLPRNDFEYWLLGTEDVKEPQVANEKP